MVDSWYVALVKLCFPRDPERYPMTNMSRFHRIPIIAIYSLHFLPKINLVWMGIFDKDRSITTYKNNSNYIKLWCHSYCGKY